MTPLELFFDLVFVFAITQVTGFISHDPTWTRLGEGLMILATLWWVWVAFAWLGNSAATDEGIMRVTLLAAMGGMLIVSLAVPRAFGANALLFGVAFLAVRCIHLLAYSAWWGDDPELRALVRRLASTMLPAAGLLVLAGVVGGTARALCWVAALAIDYGGLAVRGTEGWRVEPGHFAERFGLIVIIALGESIVSVGVGIGDLGLDAGVIGGALLGVTLAGAMWWAYFDVVARVGEDRLRSSEERERARMARDSYTYLHFPMVAGIILLAVGMKTTLHGVGHHLETVPALALCGGAALYFLAMSAFKRRNIGSFNYPRLVAAAALVALWPLATVIPALETLAVAAAIGCLLIAYEVRRYAPARDRIRHG